ncbi:hypothetical protein IGI04_018589 [Brassica rapa subsp. trilocularis]|uniref:Uncharacterized protein n=1 Tax=Brassica rapa subsp. trilocularis TaxID=1813537 RepID=A0ABQ7MFV4_BRACM|nr:hypothetical protein IGI04_018589 [Brassica rapa subsp. trilocularis]
MTREVHDFASFFFSLIPDDQHAMASTAPFMAGSSSNFHRSSPMFCVPVECSIRHPMVTSEQVMSTASLF